MTEQTRSLPSEILLLISNYYDLFHVSPEPVIVQIFEHLDVSGRACLAFTCKENARIAVEHDLLLFSSSADELTMAMDDFFFLYDLDLKDLKFCLPCGLFRSQKEESWRKRGLADISKIGGRTAIRWRRAASQ